jgi:hypothetical protein
VAENFFLTMTEQPTLMAAPTAIHIDEEWYIGRGLKQARVIRRAISPNHEGNRFHKND